MVMLWFDRSRAHMGVGWVIGGLWSHLAFNIKINHRRFNAVTANYLNTYTALLYLCCNSKTFSSKYKAANKIELYTDIKTRQRCFEILQKLSPDQISVNQFLLLSNVEKKWGRACSKGFGHKTRVQREGEAAEEPAVEISSATTSRKLD